MPKKIVFILFVLSFIVGFMLREMLIGIFHSTDLETIENVTFKKIGSDTVSNNAVIDIVKLEVPLKAIRGNYFEMIIYFKPLNNIYGDYTLDVYFSGKGGKVRTGAGKYKIKIEKEWLANEITKIGPFYVSVPAEILLGKYYLEIELTNKNSENLIGNVPEKSIEVVTYNSG